jgi:hypothetical protein
MNILVLTGYDDNMKELGDICMPSKLAYAERHGYHFECVRDYPKDVHPSWHKLQLLKDRIDQYDAILWLDADSIVTEPNRTVLYFLNAGEGWTIYEAHQGEVLHASQDWCAPADERPSDAKGINFGNFVLRNSPDTHRMLDAALIYTAYSTRTICCWEQDAINQCMREHSWFRSRVRIHPRRTLNAVHPDCKLPSITAPDPWQPGDYLIHLTNVPDRIEKARYYAEHHGAK